MSRDATGDKPICNAELARRVLNQKLWINISDEQLNSLLKFIDHLEKKDQINWIEVLKKFSEIK